MPRRGSGLSRFFQFVLVLNLAWAGIACGDDEKDGNSLEGGLVSELGLEFDSVDITKQGADLIIAYIQGSGSDKRSVVRLIINTNESGLANNTTLKNDAFSNLVSVSVLPGAGQDVPSAESGSVSFENYSFESGGEMKGEFTTLFDDGLSIRGSFKGSVREIDLN